MQIHLEKHHLKYTEAMAALTSAPEVKDALGLTNRQILFFEGTKEFIEWIIEQEQMGLQYSRVILDEKEELVGVITLKDIDMKKRFCHMGTWIGYPYWGKGYNEQAKAQILRAAFEEIGVHYVFAGAKLTNMRSRKAQEKLPYMTIDVANQFPEVHQQLEEQVKGPCILNVVKKENFKAWYAATNC